MKEINTNMGKNHRAKIVSKNNYEAIKIKLTL